MPREKQKRMGGYTSSYFKASSVVNIFLSLVGYETSVVNCNLLTTAPLTMTRIYYSSYGHDLLVWGRIWFDQPV